MTIQTYGQYAIDCYLKYFNNYLTIGTFARDMDMDIKTAQGLINRGREVLMKRHAELKIQFQLTAE